MPPKKKPELYGALPDPPLPEPEKDPETGPEPEHLAEMLGRAIVPMAVLEKKVKEGHELHSMEGDALVKAGKMTRPQLKAHNEKAKAAQDKNAK